MPGDVPKECRYRHVFLAMLILISSLPPYPDECDPFMVTLRRIFGKASEENADGGFFPIWGSCLGLQALAVLVGGSAALDIGFDSEDLQIPLKFTNKARGSRLFSKVPDDLMTSLATGMRGTVGTKLLEARRRQARQTTGGTDG